MMTFQILFKSVLGLLVGVLFGAIAGGLFGFALAGPMWLIGGMALGAMLGSPVGAGIGFWQSVRVPARRVQRSPIHLEGTRRPAYPQVSPSGD